MNDVLRKILARKVEEVVARRASVPLDEVIARARDAAGPVVSRDLFIVIMLTRIGGGSPVNVVVRGVTPRAFDVHAEVRVDGGRRPKGNEIVVGRAIASRFEKLGVAQAVETHAAAVTGGPVDLGAA